MRTYKYSKWDGTQDLSRSLDENFGALAKEILEAGDVNVALGNLVRDGFQASGDSDVSEVRPVGGLNDLLAGLEEERRLCYVAVTRSMRELYISYSSQRMLHGSMINSQPLCFFFELENVLIDDLSKVGF